MTILYCQKVDERIRILVTNIIDIISIKPVSESLGRFLHNFDRLFSLFLRYVGHGLCWTRYIGFKNVYGQLVSICCDLLHAHIVLYLSDDGWIFDYTVKTIHRLNSEDFSKFFLGLDILLLTFSYESTHSEVQKNA